MVDDEGYLTLLALYVRIVRTLASEHPDHSLVEKVLGSMCRGILFLIVFVECNIAIHLQVEFNDFTIVGTNLHIHKVVCLEVSLYRRLSYHIRA